MKSVFALFLEKRKYSIHYKWFIWLIAIRPILDTLYEMKHVSAFLSPLYWIGVITPILGGIGIIKGYSRELTQASGSMLIRMILVVVVINVLGMVLMAGISLETASIGFKIILFPLMIIYCSTYAVKEKAFNIAISAMALGSIFVYGMIAFELAFGKISSRVTTGGVEAASGLFADPVSYGLYLNVSLACWLYLYTLNIGLGRYIIACVVILTVIGIISIGHLASLAIFVLVLLLYIQHISSRRSLMAAVFALVLLAAGYMMLNTEIKLYYEPKIAREMEVLRGQRDAAQGFHGRMTRWVDYENKWADINIIGKVFGVSLDFDARIWHSTWLLITPHNDYLRMGFMAGVVGLILYVLYLLKFVIYSFRLNENERFISWSAACLLCLYSLTTTPSLYPQIVYFASLVISYTLRSDSSRGVRIGDAR